MNKLATIIVLVISVFAMSIELYAIALGPINVNPGGVSVNGPHVHGGWNPRNGITISIPHAGTWNSQTGLNVNFYGVHYDRNNGLSVNPGQIPYVGGYLNAYTNFANTGFSYNIVRNGDYSDVIADYNNQLPEYLAESERLNTEEMGALYQAQEYFSPKWYEILKFPAVEDASLQIARSNELKNLQISYSNAIRETRGNSEARRDLDSFQREWKSQFGPQQQMENFRVQQEKILDLIRKGSLLNAKTAGENLQNRIGASQLLSVPVDMLIFSISLEYARTGYLTEAEEWADFALAYMDRVNRLIDTSRRLADDELTRYWDYYGTRFFIYGAYAVSEKLYVRSYEIKRSKGYQTQTSEAFLARLYQVQGRYEDARKLWKSLMTRHTSEIDLGEQQANCGITAFFLGNNVEAEQYMAEAIRTLTAAKARLKGTVTDSRRLELINELKKEQGTLAKSSENMKRIENINAAIQDLSQLPDMHVGSCLAGCYVRMASIFTMQKRFEEGEKMLEKAMAEKKNDCFEASILGVRALMHLKKSQDPTESSVKQLETALGFCNDNIGILSKRDDAAFAQSLAEAYLLRGEVYRRMKNYGNALSDLNYAGNIVVKKDCHKTFLATVFCCIGDIYLEMGVPEKAEKAFNEAETIFRKYRVSPAMLCRLYYGQARVLNLQGKNSEAIEALNLAIDQSLIVRKTASTDVGQKADIFSDYYYLYETMIQWQYALGKAASPNEVYYAMERSRAQGLKDLMAAAQIDLLDGVEPELKARLLQEYNLACEALKAEKRKLAQLLKNTENEANLEIANQRKTIDVCEARVVRAYQAIQQASPALSSSIPTLSEATDLLEVNKVTAFEYLLTGNGTYLFVYGYDVTPRLFLLEITGKQADFLNRLDPELKLTAGPLTAQSLSRLFHSKRRTGIIDSLKDVEKESRIAAQEMAILYAILFPSDLREFLQNRQEGEYALILPDGALAQLPFEALVTQGGTNGFQNARFLIDEDVTMFYSPSLSIYYTLQSRERSRHDAVLTIGIKDYSEYNANIQLENLPGAEKESDIINAIGQKNHWDIDQLKQDATERKVRQALPGKREVHCGCHAVVENRYGNIFSYLALVRDQNGGDASNDGALTLQEMYKIRLEGCNLVFLSACETNVGRSQQGEGTWSLSRGMLAAGARTVISSNWPANDVATSELVSQFFRKIADHEGEEMMCYVDALKDAKTALRSNDQTWLHPYYWAPFVALGNK